MRSTALRIAAAATLALAVALPSAAQTNFIEFESGPVRPIALSPNGASLFVTNIPDNTLEVFTNTAGSLTKTASIPVGMEPVAVAARNNNEVWVVNHLSDSISIIDLTASPPKVVRTLLVGDEPRDIVFAGTGGNEHVFITTAHRGQHRTHSSISGVTGAGDPQLTTAGIGRADVWVFDAASLGSTMGGTPLEILTFFADTPRALAVSPSGDTVYVAAFHSGNQTTAISETLIADGFGASGVPGPNDNDNGDPAPEVGVIAKFDGADWLDADGVNRNSLVPFDLPDNDVFEVDADTFVHGQVFSSVGTILFNIAVNPSSGNLYVTNTDMENERQFEGPGIHGGSTVQGQLSKSRITVIDPSGPTISAKHLNQHIVYADLHTDAGANHAAIDAQIPHSLATPLQSVVSSTGTIYTAAFGSEKIGVFDVVDIEDVNFGTNFDPTTESANYFATDGGPSGLALDETNSRLFVLTRFNNSVSAINTSTGATAETHTLHNPEPSTITDGRSFLYDAVATSGNGESSCSSCHIFGDFDSLAWDLGNPDELISSNTQPSSSILAPATTFHPMKGPMTTQTLRGMATHGGMHWRGDRVDGFFGTDPCTTVVGAPCSEDLSFRNFIVAFEGLVGKDGTITAPEMQDFADFILQVFLPPNPVRALDNSLSAAEQDGEDEFFSCGPGTTECSLLDPNATDTVEDCDGCHNLDPISGFFASGGEQSFEGEPQNMKVPHMRNLYQKLGMFSVAGNQVRGFGMLHDGSVDTVKTFLEAGVFSLNNAQELDLEEFSLAFPSDLAPIVGQQVTLDSTNSVVVNPRIDLMIARANTSFDSLMLGGTVTECDLIVKGTVGTAERGWEYNGATFDDDIGGNSTDAALRALAVTEGPLTYTCAPPGSGNRMGVDRDQDTLLNGVETNTGTFVDASDTGTDPANEDTDGDNWNDGVEVAAGTDPNDPFDHPGVGVPSLPPVGLLALGAVVALVGRIALRTRRA
jgi:DNA-binding beta-propeller fold protein YncE